MPFFVDIPTVIHRKCAKIEFITQTLTPAMTSLSKLFTPLLITGGLAAIAYAGTCLALYNYQTNLIFRPLPFLFRTPADAGLAYEDVWIPLNPSRSVSQASSQKLHGWWMPNNSSDETLPAKGRILLLCHGNYGNVSYNVNRCRFYHGLGFSVLAFDYRGFGLSPQEDPSEQKTYEDTEAALRYLTAERQISPNKITLLGHSLGGAIAIHTAAHHPEVSNLVVECSFTSMKATVLTKSIYRPFPIEQLLNHPFDALSKVKQLQTPVLYVHGDQDPDVLPQFSQQLFDASPEPKQLWLARGAGHDNITANFSASYAATFRSFLQKVNSLEAIEVKETSLLLSLSDV